MLKQIKTALSHIRESRPLVVNLTNYVTMDLMANSLLALGGAPIMSVYDEELAELIKTAHSITINLGTLDEAFIGRVHKAVALAKQYQKKVIVDPVGSGASAIRTKTARELIVHADIVKGNASEIISLNDAQAKTFGVDSVNATEEDYDQACAIAQLYGPTVIVTGAVDFITNGTQQSVVPFGSPLMTRVTGMGCALAAVIAAFASVVPDTFNSALLATRYFGLCGQLAASKTKGPGTFRRIFIDELYRADFARMARL